MGKEILIVGGGGREHALAFALKKNKDVSKIWCLPGNGGISALAECVDIAATDLSKIVNFVEQHPKIVLTVVAPDDPLALGLVDKLNEKGFRAFGPTQNAAQLEASKAFAKNLMKKYSIPTASYEVFENLENAQQFVSNCSIPIVIKADGLALGKGVFVCLTREEAQNALVSIMGESKFGAAGSRVVVEEFLSGYEVSVLAFCDGKTILPLETCQDHKRVFDNDEGKNTGGMGAFSPSQKFGKDEMAWANDNIFLPTLKALNNEGILFKGIIYFGLMVDGKTSKVVEYNARFGDPETQAVLVRLENDLLELLDKTIDQKLDEVTLNWKKEQSICVVLASGGYPDAFKKGLPITIGALEKDVVVFHAATRENDCGVLSTNGGRVLNVVATGKDLEEARKKAYRNIEKISFENMHYRKDIGKTK